MTVDPLTRTVREQVALGRLLPLGGPEDAVWITERAVVRALRRAVAPVPGVRIGKVAVVLGEGLAQPVPDAAPVGALPHLPVRIEADFEGAAAEPLPRAAERLRLALASAAATGIGLDVEAVDLRVTGLLDGAAPDAGLAAPAEEAEPEPEFEPDAPDGHGAVAAAARVAALSVPGVRGLTRGPGGVGGALSVHEEVGHVRVRLATAAGYVPLTVARGVAAALTHALAPRVPAPLTPAVLVTHIA